METTTISWPVSQFKTLYESEKINLDYPIQRPPGQWKQKEAEGFINSLADDYPVPALYSTFHDAKKKSDGTYFKRDQGAVKVYDVIDGLQRLTTIFSYLDNKWATSEQMDEEDAWVSINDEDYNIEGKYFKDLDPVVQGKIKSRMLTLYRVEGTEREILRLFYKLNSGMGLTNQQKYKAKMGVKWAHIFAELRNHPAMRDVFHFSEGQLKKSNNELALIQSMMLLDDTYELKDFSSKEIGIYSYTFNKDIEKKEKIVGILKSTLDYINSAEIKKAKHILNKTHFPIVIHTAQLFLKDHIKSSHFAKWIEEFSKSLKGKGDIPTAYKDYMKGGSTKKTNILGKISEMERHCKEFINKEQILA
ncbi:hypothetical protein BCM26_03830 [Bacillus subtilis]|nr:hypothetical protein BCM26_03830 [Bacillus subtilis]OJH64032.1 hypothetical protein BOH71_06760 [Bacillus subtilis]